MTILAPLPYANQEPHEDLMTALSLLNIAGLSLEEQRGLAAEEGHDLLVLIDEVRDKLPPILRFLCDLDLPGTTAVYQRARIAELE